MAQASGMLGNGSKAIKVHHLIKAPENTPESVRRRESWDATEPRLEPLLDDKGPEDVMAVRLSHCAAACALRHLIG